MPAFAQAALLRRAPGYRLLFLAAAASGIGTWLAVIALSVDVYDRTGSARWVSALLVADFVPTVLIGITLGPLVDRISRKLLLVGSDVVRLAVFAALPFADSPARIVALAGVAGFATGFFRPASYAGLPNLVDSEDLPAANSLLRTMESLTTMSGTFLGGVFAAAWGPHPAYWINAVSFGVSALLLLRLPSARLQEGRSESRGYVRDLADGFELVRRSRALLAVFVSWNLMMFTTGFVNVAEIALAKVSFNSGSFGFGLLWTASGVGAVLGSLSATVLLARRGLPTLYGAALALMGFGAGAAAASPNVWVAAWCMAVLGAGNGAAIVFNSLLVQRGAPDRLRGRAFTVIMSGNFALFGIAMIVAGPLTDELGARWVYAAAAAVACLAALVGRALVRGVPDHAEEPKPAAALS